MNKRLLFKYIPLLILFTSTSLFAGSFFDICESKKNSLNRVQALERWRNEKNRWRRVCFSADNIILSAIDEDISPFCMPPKPFRGSFFEGKPYYGDPFYEERNYRILSFKNSVKDYAKDINMCLNYVNKKIANNNITLPSNVQKNIKRLTDFLDNILNIDINSADHILGYNIFTETFGHEKVATIISETLNEHFFQKLEDLCQVKIEDYPEEKITYSKYVPISDSQSTLLQYNYEALRNIQTTNDQSTYINNKTLYIDTNGQVHSDTIKQYSTIWPDEWPHEHVQKQTTSPSWNKSYYTWQKLFTKNSNKPINLLAINDLISTCTPKYGIAKKPYKPKITELAEL
ncbi:MAG TPA: hypothetical protein VGW78_05270 [Candidatus Babeliales bacterium]|jgi:hypothetical protein|nr:hypothetical protein [Candidatus Babeliales bacterium]